MEHHPAAHAPEFSQAQHSNNTHIAASTMATKATMAPEKKPFDISNLMSPPEPAPLDNFGLSIVVKTDHQRQPMAMKPTEPLSPPISPFTQTSNSHDAEIIRSGAADPVLFPASSDVSSSPPQPLFSSPVRPSTETDTSEREVRDQVDRHIGSRPTTMFRQISPPRREDYNLMIAFTSTVMQRFQEDPKGFLRDRHAEIKKQRAFIKDRAAAAAKHKQRHLTSRADKTPDVLRPAPARVNKPEPRRTVPRTIATHAHIAPNTSAVSHRRTSSVQAASHTPEPRSRPVAPSREDKDFASLVDVTPDIHSLPNRPGILKVDWKGSPLDISQDPHLHLLHPEEQSLAAMLRLDPATYLTSKRRIFISRLECAKRGKEFRKTDAQQACKIDVNKASKLWTAYDKVGWLDISWVQRYMDMKN